mmetsp:Transcript_61383/g.176688  ORF Transcript_61383/g.176688 Transcript_61383/m.176688 type:complete len:303 (+) Transcript_61383:35-943(+)
MSIREIKAELASLGVPYADVTEKSELLQRLEEARARSRAPRNGREEAQSAPPPVATASGQGAPGSKPSSLGGPVASEIRRISKLTAGDHYAVLEVARDVDADALKRAYRKKALLLHPDKCALEGASEAFKRVSAAYAVLSDPQQRRRFDFTGPATADGGSGGGAGFPGSRFADQDAEELFRAFFGSGTSSGGLGGFNFGSFSNIAAGAKRPSASSSSTAVDAHEGGLVTRLTKAFVKNPWTLVTLLSGLASLSNIIEMLFSSLGSRMVLLVPMAIAGLYACPSEHRRVVGMVLAAVIFSGWM